MPRLTPRSERELRDDDHPRAAESLEEMVLARLREYVASLQGHTPENLYALILPQLERPLIVVAMELSEGRQSHAAAMLGIHRNTLRARLKALGLPADVGRPEAEEERPVENPMRAAAQGSAKRPQKRPPARGAQTADLDPACAEDRCRLRAEEACGVSLRSGIEDRGPDRPTPTLFKDAAARLEPLAPPARSTGARRAAGGSRK